MDECSSGLKKKNKILVRALHGNGKAYHPTEPIRSYSVFHVLDVDTGEISTLNPILIDDTLYGHMVVVDSRVYVVGRLIYPPDKPRKTSIHIHRALSYLDLNEPDHVWKGAPVMSPEPLAGACVSFCGKLYLFRGSYGSLVCEVFDSELCQWLRIKSPPLLSESIITPPIMADPLNYRILVCFDELSTLLAYYPHEDKWVDLVHDFIGWDKSQRNEVVFADGIIYVHDSGLNNRKLRAYDVATNQWLKVILPSDFQSSIHCCYNFLHYLGQGILCVLSFPTVFDLGKSNTCILVHQLKVELQNDPKEVLVTSLSFETYYPLDSIFHVRHCLPI